MERYLIISSLTGRALKILGCVASQKPFLFRTARALALSFLIICPVGAVNFTVPKGFLIRLTRLTVEVLRALPGPVKRIKEPRNLALPDKAEVISVL